ncbi:MAG TPA: peptidase S41 [Bacteroidetes bacterium]|nr:peptidase S41 [Bacteroidota bacterium]
MRRFRKWTLVLALSLAALIPLAFVSDNLFEVSKNLDIFASLYKEVNTLYVDDIDPGKFMRTGIDAMLNSLDPFTNYISEAEIEGFRFQTTGKYGGIGATVRKQGDYIALAEPYQGFAADKAGLLAGDVILEIDGQSTKGKSIDDVSKVLKGSPGTTIKLLIQRPGDANTMVKEFAREEIKINSVPYSGMLNSEIGYIRLSQFTEQCGKDVADALKDLKSKNPGMKGLVFDLRGNPGGLLNEAVNVVNVFVDKGQLVVKTKGKVAQWNKDYKSLNEPIDLNIPVVVLTNSGSASASEIVSGALQDLDRAVIVGQKTYGKGLVQTTQQLSYGTQLKVTTAHYFTPSGRCIQAIDYAHRNEDGSVGKIPDSLKTAFKTAGGRTVYDGGGIDPDIILDAPKYSNIAKSLVEKNFIFDFATLYHQQHSTIADAKTFRLSDADWNAFVDFLKGKDYDYSTKTEDALKQLQKSAEGEKYFESIQSDYDLIKNKIHHDKDQDIQTNKDEIKKILEQEIVSRYYYQNGRIISTLESDPEVKKGIDVLNDLTLYSNTLKFTK